MQSAIMKEKSASGKELLMEAKRKLTGMEKFAYGMGQ